MRLKATLLVSLGLFACEPPPQARPMQATVNPEAGGSFAAEERAYLQELDRLRKEIGLEPVDHVVDTADEALVQQTTESIQRGSTPVDDGLYSLIEHFSKKTGFPFSAIAYTPQTLDGWIPEYPPELLQRPRIVATVSIAFTGSQFLVVLLYGDMDYTP